jgi:hypothetical protein
MADWSVRSRSSAHAPIRGAAARGEETLLIEWPKGKPTKYWLSTLDKDKSFCTVVDRAKMPLAVSAELWRRAPYSVSVLFAFTPS